ncbi:TonB-dependent receptor [Porphyrobacter sp. AAP60]|uniref:TonB-dependent receptor n=1 Tax=Porphyrobacter sp. AAP60 TaxID=1523423 RepID=UPI0006BA08D7|nr:TonB-dependent receptor [Porphyrobacter sp. AAP60]KPF62497.1 TonB-dependent receptor [Porphyrobacter sp. AAP60]
MQFASHAPSRRKFVLGTASCLALSVALAAPAMAQDAEVEEEAVVAEPAEGDIVVTGFRASLQSAQSIKRRADTVVDVITAEDIGALPDRSVAETLQRIPGVNIGRFEKTSDPTRFSVEGTGVIIRGLPYVSSQLNGRDIFSANGGRALSFEDISPELVGRVETYKNITADQIEGHIAGLVNLVTRKPLDRRGFRIAGSVEANYGDLRQEWSPTVNVLVSDTFETGQGTFGLQLSYSKSELKSRTDASQLVDFCYRPADLSAGCARIFPLNSGGFGDVPNFTPDNFPPANSVLVPQFANVRSTTLDRDREAFSAVGQFETLDGDLVMTLEFLRSETTFTTEEFALLGRIDDGVSTNQPRPGTSYQFDPNGNFVSGILTQNVGDAYANPFGRGGIPMDSLRFLREANSVTQDISFDATMNFSEQFRGKVEMQSLSSNLTRDSVFGALSTWADISVDLSGKTPDIQFLAPVGAPADYFSSGLNNYYWFGLDSREQNEGELFTLAGSLEYDLSEDGFFRRVEIGGRWAARDRINRNTNFSTWGNLSAPWAGRAGCAPWNEGPGCAATGGFVPGRFFTGLPGQEFAIAGGVFADEFATASAYRTPFADNFQRGEASTPIAGGGAFFYGGDDFLQEYLDGVTQQQWDDISTLGQSPERFNLGVSGRTRTLIDGTVVQCDTFCPEEISDVTEITSAAYARLDFGTDFGGGASLTGNIGLRYVRTKVGNNSVLAFPDPARFDQTIIENGVNVGGNGDGIVQVAEIQAVCRGSSPGVPQQAFCDLTGARLAEFAALHTGELIRDNRPINFDHFLPAFNVRYDNGDGIVVRGAVSKGISRPDLNLFNASGVLGFSGRVNDGPLLSVRTGNRNVMPTEAWNYDLSFEYYFANVGQLSLALFAKDITGIISNGTGLVNYTTPGGTSQDVIISGPANDIDGLLKGVEFSYQQTFDFLPGFLDGLGTAVTYTYIDAGDFPNPNISGIGSPSVNSSGQPLNNGPFGGELPLGGTSKHTVNATLFYEKGPLSIRTAYNWRSAFLVTPRDDLFPFSAIYQDAGGQLDGTIFYSVTPNIKLGVQGVNLLDETTQLSTVVDFDGTRPTSAVFRNDRRFTFIARFNF